MTSSSWVGIGSIRMRKAALASVLAILGVTLASAPSSAASRNEAPVVSSAFFGIAADPQAGEKVGTISATNRPTSWALSGTGSQYFAISLGAGGSGNVAVGASSPPSGSYSLVATATNFAGSGTGSVAITVAAAPVVSGVCGAASGQSASSAPTTGLCSAGTASAVSGSGPWAWTCAGSNGGATASCSASVLSGATSTPSYAASTWSNYPQSPNYFPSVLFWQILSTTIPGYSSFLAAMNGTGMNTLLTLNGPNGGMWSPSSFGVDSAGYLSQIAAAGVYLIPQVNATTAPCGSGASYVGNLTPNNTDICSVASYQALIANTGLTSTIIGYQMADEPETVSCTNYPMSGIPGQVAIYKGYDSTRPFFMNSTNYIVYSGLCNPFTLNTNYMAAISIGSFDMYPLTSPWFAHNVAGTGSPVDSMWVQGWSVAQMISERPAGAPFWVNVDSGTDELGFSSQNSFTCTPATNTCTNGSVTIWERAPANLVNAEVWISIINGAVGIEWFCQDSAWGSAGCMGEGGSAGALAAQANVTYVNSNLKTFAPVLNSTTVGICTMNTGITYTSYTTSCSNGILTMSTGTSTVPGSALVKSYAGATYLIAQPARYGSAAFTFTLTGLAGKTATVIYDSNSQYDAAHTTLGATAVLSSSAQFVDTLGANGDNYQVKIYKIQ